jgi:hypothetical protein
MVKYNSDYAKTSLQCVVAGVSFFQVTGQEGYARLYVFGVYHLVY